MCTSRIRMMNQLSNFHWVSLSFALSQRRLQRDRPQVHRLRQRYRCRPLTFGKRTSCEHTTAPPLEVGTEFLSPTLGEQFKSVAHTWLDRTELPVRQIPCVHTVREALVVRLPFTRRIPLYSHEASCSLFQPRALRRLFRRGAGTGSGVDLSLHRPSPDCLMATPDLPPITAAGAVWRRRAHLRLLPQMNGSYFDDVHAGRHRHPNRRVALPLGQKP